MISVVRYATAFEGFLDANLSLSQKLDCLCQAANEALQRTPDELVVGGKKILKSHFRGRIVVDSGAQGIVYFFEGMRDAACGRPVVRDVRDADEISKRDDVDADVPVAYEDVVTHDCDCDTESGETFAYPDHRFCTECIFTSVKGSVNIETLRAAMRPLGDSIVPIVVPSAEEGVDTCKVHIHTNLPERVFAAGRSMARDGKTLLREKCEDMRTQVECNRYRAEVFGGGDSKDANIEIIGYSSCDMPDTLHQNMKMLQVPAFINIDGREYVDDGVDISKEAFFRIYRSTDPIMKTAAPSALNIKRAFERALARKGRTDAIWITPSFAFSQALMNNFKVALSLMPEEQRRRCHIFDSKACGPSEALMILEARRYVHDRKGSAKVEALLTHLDRSARPRTNVLFVLPTLKYAIRGGRLKGSKAKLGAMFNILPIMSCLDGEIKPVGKVFGCGAFERAKRKMLHLLRKRIPKGRPVTFILLHACNPYTLSDQEDYLRRNFNVRYIFTAPLSCAIAVHSGPGGIGIGYSFEEKDGISRNGV
eukprot:g157.t1